MQVFLCFLVWMFVFFLMAEFVVLCNLNNWSLHVEANIWQCGLFSFLKRHLHLFNLLLLYCIILAQPRLHGSPAVSRGHTKENLWMSISFHKVLQFQKEKGEGKKKKDKLEEISGLRRITLISRINHSSIWTSQYREEFMNIYLWQQF